jgi:hypothetical protein
MARSDNVTGNWEGSLIKTNKTSLMFENFMADKITAGLVLINHLYKYESDVLFITLVCLD